MTQSNDGTSGKPGTAHRTPGQPPATIAAGKPADIPMLPAPSAVSVVTSSQQDHSSVDTEDMQDLLRKIASQIAEAEQRQGAALDGVRSRLTNLAEQTVAAKSEAPTDLQPGLGSIETRIAQMAQTVETANREIKSTDAAPKGPQLSATQPPPVSANMHVRGFGRGQVRGSNDVPASDRGPGTQPVSQVSAPPAVKPAAPTGPSVRSPATAESEATGPWDQAAADALAKIFRDEEEAHDRAQPTPAARPTLDPSKQPRPEPPALASASTNNQPARTAVPAPATPPSPTSTAAFAGAATGAMTGSMSGATFGGQPMTSPALGRSASTPPMTPPTTSPPPARTMSPPLATPAVAARPGTTAPSGGGDREWLNARFSEIAAQVERSLKESRPERVLTVLGQRFDKLESSLASVVTSVRANAEQSTGQAALQALDTQVTGLKTQVDGIVVRLEGLDAIKADVSALSLKLGALERLETTQTQVAALLSGTRSDIDNLARSMLDQRSGTAAMALAGGEVASDTRINSLHELVEAHSAERREGEAATVAVLQAIQGAIDQLTSRLEQFEEAVTHTVLAGQELAAAEPIEPPHAHASRTSAMAPAHDPAPSHRIAPNAPAYEPEPMAVAVPEMPQTRGRAASKTAEAPAAPVEAAIPRTRRGLGGISLSSNAAADESAGRGHRRGKPEPATPSRETMLETARRASGADAPDEEAGDVEAETIATRLPGQKRAKDKAPRGGFFTFEKAGTRPVHVVLLVALLAAGAGMLYGTLADRTQPMPIHNDKPKAPLGKVGAVQQGADSPRLDDPRPRVGDATAGATQAGSRSAGADPNRTPDEADDADMKASDLKEAALSVLKPSADTEAAPLHTSSSLPPAPGEGTAISTGILIDSGAPMPSARDLKRYSAEQRMARISSQLGDKAVQKTEVERAWPASHTPDAAAPEVRPEAAPAAAAAINPTGLPPAQIGPMSLRVAAAKGDPSAEFEVASRFAQGKGVPKDFAKAAEWYQRAASRGSAPAQYRLGGLYERGIGIKADPARARAWYKRAADLGNVKAMHNLAVMHTQRDSGEPDYATASQWFTKAANHGLSDSQFNLAILHENGMGVTKNMADAYKWYALAAERGDPEAAKRRDAVGGRLAMAEIERIRVAIAKWRPQMTDPAANDPMMAGQAWRNRHGDDQMGSGMGSTRPAAAPRPVSTAPAQPREAEMIDLSSAAIDAQMKVEQAALKHADSVASTQQEATAAGAASAGDQQQAIMNRKRKVTKVQNPADVEKMLTQFGYNPSALKKARPGGSPEETMAPAPQRE